MAERYDAVVVGAGLGGLSVATYLANKGQKVVVLERHNVPGGYSTSFVRGRYEFEVALHELSGIAPNRPTPLSKYLESIGVAQKVEFINIPEMYRCVFPYFDITMPTGRAEYTETLIEAFPSEEQGIREFLDLVFSINSEVAKVLKTQKLGNPLTAPSRFKHLIRYLPTTWGEVLDRYVKDPYLKAVFSQYWGYFGLPPGQVSFLYFASALASYISLGPSFIKGRSQALANAFVETLEEKGGEIRLNCGAEKIHVHNGKVVSVTTSQGDEIPCDFVASNADPITTTREMIGEEHIPDRFFRKLQSERVAPSTVNLYLGLAKPAEELGLTNHEIFINADYDLDNHYKHLQGTQTTDEVALTTYNEVYPDISPPGTTVAVVTSLAMGEPWYDVPPEKYVETKTRLADRMLNLCEMVAPEIRDYAEVIEVATPLTNMRYAGSMGGSIYGFDNTPYNHSVLRMSPKGPVSGLYFVGAWTQPGGGFEPAMMSGMMAGRMIRRKANSQKKGA